MAGGSTTPRNLLLPVVDKLRGIPGLFGLRLFTVSVVTRTWNGSRPGVDSSTSSDTTTGIKVDVGTYQTKVTQITTRDVIASGGIYTDQDVRVGPITPPYTGSAQDGDAITVFDPAPGVAPAEIFFNIKGPGYPTAGAWFKKLSQDVTRPMHYEFVLRRSAETP
jgi:hypothetical protein